MGWLILGRIRTSDEGGEVLGVLGVLYRLDFGASRRQLSCLWLVCLLRERKWGANEEGAREEEPHNE